jgi:hypothetical protein
LFLIWIYVCFSILFAYFVLSCSSHVDGNKMRAVMLFWTISKCNLDCGHPSGYTRGSMERWIFSVTTLAFIIKHHRNSILHTVCLSPARIFLVNPTLIFRLIAPVSQAIYRGSIG